MVAFLDKFCKTEFEKLHTALYLHKGCVKVSDPEGLILKNNFTLFNIGIFKILAK